MRWGIWDIPNKVLCSGELGVGIRVGDICIYRRKVLLSHLGIGGSSSLLKIIQHSAAPELSTNSLSNESRVTTASE